ncbi:MAG: hypothetical protein ACRDM1_05595 [Gaiellaceae bacterium]
MLGVPSQPGAAGYAVLLLGFAAVIALAFVWRRRRPRDAVGGIAACACAIVVAVAPYVIWRIVEDLRVTTAMSAYDRSVSGPVQAYLQPYLLDPVRGIIPPHATYATAVGTGVPYDTARRAFPSLALETLFPRISKPPREAQWIVAWGTAPGSVAPVGRVIVARRASGAYPALLVARVRR